MLGLRFEDGTDHVGTALEWEVRVQGKPVEVHAEHDLPARAVADIFPAYDDEEGGVLRRADSDQPPLSGRPHGEPIDH